MKRLISILILIILSLSLFAENRGLGVLRSLALPGYSQVSAGHNYGYALMASEVAAIGSYLYMNEESSALMHESYEYAIKFGHVNPGDYDADFYYNLSRFDSSGFDVNGYNAMIREEAMEQFPYDPVAQQNYIDTNSYKDDRFWDWDSTDNRSHFNKLRNKSDDYEDYAKVTMGVIILNHLVSAVDYLRFSARERNSNVSFRYVKKTPMMFLTYKW